MSTRRKRATFAPGPRYMFRSVQSLAQLARIARTGQVERYTTLRNEVRRGEAVELRTAGRVLFATAEGQLAARRSAPRGVAGLTVAEFAAASGVDRADAADQLTAARDRGEVVELRTSGETRYARVAGGHVVEVPA